MKYALHLAKKAGEKTFPNPNVGCVIVKNDKIIAEGFHRFFGDKHAEIHALEKAGYEAKDAELFVTLEPCSHFGKTPPCTNAIIESGIKKVYIGLTDPNPLINGKGIEILKASGIEVESGIIDKELKKFYESYSKRFKRNKSFVAIKFAMTLDGKIATFTGDSKWISSEKSRKFVHKLRTNFDGILVGVKTIIRDDPELSSHGYGKNPVRIIIDPELEIPIKAKVLNDDIPTIVVHSKKKSEKKLELIQKKGKIPVYIPQKNGLIDFNNILGELRKLSIFSVLIEGGGFTTWGAIESGSVDEIYTFISPKIIGGEKAISPVEGKGVKKINDAIKLKYIEFKKIDDDIFIKSKLVKD